MPDRDDVLGVRWPKEGCQSLREEKQYESCCLVVILELLVRRNGTATVGSCRVQNVAHFAGGARQYPNSTALRDFDLRARVELGLRTIGSGPVEFVRVWYGFSTI